MKKFIKKIGLVIASIACFFALNPAPLTTFAEESTIVSKESTETGEISKETEKEEEIPTEEETEENEANNEVENESTTELEPTFEDFLAWAKEQAELYGYGNEYAKAIDALKAAATQKQVTLSTIASFAFAAFVLALIISGKIKDKKYKAAVVELSNKIDKLSKGANTIIEGENAILEDGRKIATHEAKTTQKASEVKAEVQTIKRSLSAFISAFLRFTDGIKLGDNKKTEVQTNCLNALKEIEEVRGNEDNEK